MFEVAAAFETYTELVDMASDKNYIIRSFLAEVPL